MSFVKRVFNRLSRITSSPAVRIGDARCQVEQLVLRNQYRSILETGGRAIPLSDTGFSQHSQHEEDGLLLYVFSLIGTTNKVCVEMCAGNGVECNTANLLRYHQWTGALFDGNPNNVATAKQFFSSCQSTKFWQPSINQAWITTSNVNELISEQGIEGEIDLFSLDLDGVDYWIWKELSCISPRVVILEFNHLWGDELSVTVPYRDDFVAEFTEYGSDYAGASLMAFVNLAKIKGYHLVGTNAIATNAIFVRDFDSHPWLPEIEPASCFTHPRARFGMTVRRRGIENKEWVNV